MISRGLRQDEGLESVASYFATLAADVPSMPAEDAAAAAAAEAGAGVGKRRPWRSGRSGRVLAQEVLHLRVLLPALHLPAVPFGQGAAQCGSGAHVEEHRGRV